MVVYSADTLTASSQHGEDKKHAVHGNDEEVDLKSWMHRHGLPPCKVTLKERPSPDGKHRPIKYIAASEDLQVDDGY